LLATFNALLSIARAEAGQAREGLHPTDLVPLAGDVAELYGPIAEEAGGKLDLDLPETAIVRADRQLVAQALANLLDNAMKYGRDEKTGAPIIRLSIEAQPGGGRAIIISDTGPGIAEADRERVKDRFVRLDKSRTEPGSGLGLALVDSVMKLHGGKLLIGDAGPGLAVKLVFPGAPS
jgi:signal transduction histidine kinase